MRQPRTQQVLSHGSAEGLAVKVVYDTVGKLADDGYRLSCFCVGCRHSGFVSYKDLATRLGRDHTFFVKDKLRCSKCGGRDLEARYHPPTAPRR